MLGSGNTATVLSALIIKAGHELVQVISRKPENAQKLASIYGADTGSFSDVQFSDADLFIIALSHFVHFQTFGQEKKN